MTVALPPLDANGMCLFCVDGAHRRCVDPDCECDAGKVRGPGRHHLNRPPSRGRTPPDPNKENDVSATAPIPIDRAKEKKPEPTYDLKKIGELPAKAKTMRMGDRVKQLLDGNELEPCQWYELIKYPEGSGAGAGGAATRLGRDTRLAGYEFEARRGIVYVRLIAA